MIGLSGKFSFFLHLKEDLEEEESLHSKAIGIHPRRGR
jgi:hypothetical protein